MGEGRALVRLVRPVPRTSLCRVRVCLRMGAVVVGVGVGGGAATKACWGGGGGEGGVGVPLLSKCSALPPPAHPSMRQSLSTRQHTKARGDGASVWPNKDGRRLFCWRKGGGGGVVCARGPLVTSTDLRRGNCDVCAYWRRVHRPYRQHPFSGERGVTLPPSRAPFGVGAGGCPQVVLRF